MKRNFINKGKQSVYVRRTQTELDGMKMTFFAEEKKKKNLLDM